MRVKALIVLALASLILLGTTSPALAEDLSWLNNLPGLNGGLSVNDLSNGSNSLSAQKQGTGQGAVSMPAMLDWLCSTDGSSLPGLGGTVPDALLTGAPINDGMALTTTGSTGLIVPDLAAQGLGVDASINNILSQFSF
jgi:hypothetical protein